MVRSLQEMPKSFVLFPSETFAIFIPQPLWLSSRIGSSVKKSHFIHPVISEDPEWVKRIVTFSFWKEIYLYYIIFNLVISLVPYVEGGTWRRSKFQGSNFKVDQQHFCKMTHVAKLFQNRYIYSMKRVPKINWPFEK